MSPSQFSFLILFFSQRAQNDQKLLDGGERDDQRTEEAAASLHNRKCKGRSKVNHVSLYKLYCIDYAKLRCYLLLLTIIFLFYILNILKMMRKSIRNSGSRYKLGEVPGIRYESKVRNDLKTGSKKYFKPYFKFSVCIYVKSGIRL